MYTTTSLIVSNSTLANFLAWAQWIHDQLTAAGWTQIHFTGEANLATQATVPTSGNYIYELWSSGSGGGLNPFYARLGYGNNAGGAPTLSLQAGWAYNATTGALSGTFITPVFVPQVSTSVATAQPWAFTGDAHRFAICCNTSATSSINAFICLVERSRDDVGAYSNDGFYFGSMGANNQAFYQPQTQVAAAASGHGWTVALPSSIPSLVPLVANNNAPISPFYFYKGAPLPPPISLMSFWAPDFSTLTTNSIEVFGTPRNYLFLGGHNFSMSYTSWRAAFLQE